MSDIKFSADDIRAIFSKSFTARGRRTMERGGHEQPCFYENDHAIVFPPVSDLETSLHFESISEAMNAAEPLWDSEAYGNKKIIFPIAEQQGILGIQRNHWVTLYYDPDTETATLIDSRPWSLSFWYNTIPMKDVLLTGLKILNRPFNNVLHIKYQNIQYDDVCCGYWTTINIQALASGVSIDEQPTALSAEDKPHIIKHLQDTLAGKISSVYQPLNTFVEINNEDNEDIEANMPMPLMFITDIIYQNPVDEQLTALPADDKSPDFKHLQETMTEKISPVYQWNTFVEINIENNEDIEANMPMSSISTIDIINQNPVDEQLTVLPAEDKSPDFKHLQDTMTGKISPVYQSLNTFVDILIEDNEDIEANMPMSSISTIDIINQNPVDEAISAYFFISISCSNVMKTTGIVLLIVGLIAFFLKGVALASEPAATSMKTAGLDTPALLSIGTSGIAGGSILMAGYFMQKNREINQERPAPIEHRNCYGAVEHGITWKSEVKITP